MNRKEKNALSRQRILEAALEEFSRRGYEAASLSNVCAEKGISKGIIYHHFKDKDELFLLCVEDCFTQVSAYLQEAAGRLSGTSEAVLPQAKDYAFWMFIAALFNLPAQSLNCAARAEAIGQLCPALLFRQEQYALCVPERFGCAAGWGGHLRWLFPRGEAAV